MQVLFNGAFGEVKIVGDLLIRFGLVDEFGELFFT